MTASIFIRSYINDYEWLALCLRSIQKFATGFKEIVIAVPQGQDGPLRGLTAERVVTVNDAQPGYLAQQVTKLTADLHCDADFILHIDSDTVLQKPITPQSFLRDGKPVWLMTPWDECMDAKKAWFHVQARLFMECPTHDFMRRNLMLIPRFAYGALRDFIKERHGHAMDAYVMNAPGREFSEYNALGFYLWQFHRDKIAWHDTAKLGVPEAFERQNWSWGGLTPQIRAEIEAILA